MPSIVKPIFLQQIPALPTNRLLAYLQRLRRCEESAEQSDIGTLQRDPENPGIVVHHVTQDDIDREVEPATIRFKDDPRWGELYQAIKRELATREHIPGGHEPKGQDC